MLAIELFCCAGGMAEGFRRAGVSFDLAFDADPDACASYERNLGRAPVRMDVRDLLRLAQTGWRPQCWLLVADPPCTPWSSGGKRQGLDDPRDCLRPTIALIDAIRPDAYLIGNVPGLEHQQNAGALEETIGSLGASGYCTADFCVFDAADFGVPQHRIRPFWFGHRKGTPCIDWPTRTHGPPTTNLELPGTELLPWVTAGDALSDLPDALLGVQCTVAEHGRSHSNEVEIAEPARTQNANPHGCAVLRLNRKHPPTRPDAPARTVTARDRRQGDVMVWLDERPATTVTHQRWISHPGQTGSAQKPYQGSNAIVLSELARARLQGFPDRWHFAGKTKRSRNAQIGMAMPPPLAEAVARAVVQWRRRASVTVVA